MFAHKLTVLSIIIYFLALKVHAEWHFFGKVWSKEFPDLKGQYKIQVVIQSGGVWIGKCGEVTANVDGSYDITCSPSFNVLGKKRVNVFHRLGDGKCHNELIEGADEGEVNVELSSSDPKTVYGCSDDKY